MKLSKSKLALAKVINENGGWKFGEFAWYGNATKSGYFGTVKPTYNVASGTLDTFGWIEKFECTKIVNWHQTILSREEYYQAYPKADADGWIEWTLDELPVEKGTVIDVKYSDGDELHGAPCGEFAAGLVSIRGEPARAEQFGLFDDGVASIIAYRLHKPDVKPEFCESVMRSIPEPESIDWLCANVTEENKHQHVDAKPTIEQLAQDYRNKLNFANSKQKEADEAKAAADAALGELGRAGEALGLLIGIAKPYREPKLVITDWRDLMVGDVVEITGSSNNCWKDHSGREMTVKDVYPEQGDNDDQVDLIGESGAWCLGGNTTWRFIRRP